jgi:hypothetical protein
MADTTHTLQALTATLPTDHPGLRLLALDVAGSAWAAGDVDLAARLLRAAGAA